MYNLLITAAQLQQLQTQGKPCAVLDCSFDLMNPDLADGFFASERIAGALPAHLNKNLSTHQAEEAVNGGRHPLPQREVVARWLGNLGLHNGMQIVVYDRNKGHYCGRLWWMLKWLGHEAVAVLDGGLQAWKDMGGALASGPDIPLAPAHFELKAPLRQLMLTDAVSAALGQQTQTVVDARAGARYRGEVEPLDPVAGHIPGALNRPFTENFTEDGRFKSAPQLKTEWDQLLAGRPASSVVHHCGSGVTAVPNVIAMELAGYGPTALYAGSWSEWSRTPGLPCAQG
ncbi:sulfurtransferase [uncultured Limnohabitans sp.]|jgi:thiosulfate/3-mercaptopyruvate sulfurtransferase|uniref:sulfurtransferase n=1 Tax=uncultured Limnohabitans sp. TaxID=768543 RepID=UPI002612E290|nr:sulfurtransferase [uncultured Limnohabitans sp.]